MAAEAVNSKLAVLIDADNASPLIAEALLAEVAKYGTSFVRRAYGDWTGSTLKGWKEQLLTRSIQPIQQFAYTHGKNATDSAMIIDAMDLLYTNRFDGFCLVSSDSDFTRLAARIRESGLVVYGFGERKTPQPFVAACDKFIYFENLNVQAAATTAANPDGSLPAPPQPSSAATSPPPKRAPLPLTTTKAEIDAKLVWELRTAVEASWDEEGWANLAKVGGFMSQRRPDFDQRTYGYLKLSDLVAATNAFEIETRPSAAGKTVVMFARYKGK